MKRLKLDNNMFLLIIITVLVVFIALFSDDFLTLENIFDIMRSYSFMGVLSLGVLVVLVSGGMDLSFTAIATVTQYLLGLLLTVRTSLPIAAVLFIPLFSGIMLGLFNAFLISRLKVPSIIVTIATLNLFYGLLMFFSRGRWMYEFPSWFSDFAQINFLNMYNDDGYLFGLSVFSVIWFSLIIIFSIFLNFSTLGKKIYATGGNEEAAFRSGIDITFIKYFVYSLMGFIAALGGIVQAQLTQTIAPNAIMGKELEVIAAVVLGGAGLSGGTGSVTGTVLGVGLIAILTNSLTLLKISSYWQQACIGIIICLSVILTALRNSRIRKRAVIIEK